MPVADIPFRCLIYCPLPYSGRGWPQTCVGVSANLPAAGVFPVLVTPRLRKPLPPSIKAVESMPFPLSGVPWKFIRRAATRRLEDVFACLLREADPRHTIAHFWPGSPSHLVELARDAGIVSVREMINTCQGTAKSILDRAYDRLQLPRTHTITELAVRDEQRELRLYDYVFAPSSEVEKSLLKTGVERARIVPTSYGWFPERFGRRTDASDGGKRPFQALFAGLVCVRKGVPELLDAWAQSNIEGELLLVGDIEPALRQRVTTAVQTGRVRHVAYTDDIGAYYRSADLFVFPSLEEGCPQVTMEAGGCGLPVVATPMGAGRLVEDGINGLIVRPGDTGELARALQRLAEDRPLRQHFSARIAKDAQAYTYDRVSALRGSFMANVLQGSARPASHAQ